MYTKCLPVCSELNVLKSFKKNVSALKYALVKSDAAKKTFFFLQISPAWLCAEKSLT